MSDRIEVKITVAQATEAITFAYYESQKALEESRRYIELLDTHKKELNEMLKKANSRITALEKANE
jgi:hypothetical protein